MMKVFLFLQTQDVLTPFTYVTMLHAKQPTVAYCSRRRVLHTSSRSTAHSILLHSNHLAQPQPLHVL
jgi:hypothetical protein